MSNDFTIRVEEGFTLSGYTNVVSDLRPVWDDAVKVFYDIEQEQFDSQGHDKWQPLSANYAAWKAIHYPGKSLLVRSGDLVAAMTGKGAQLKKEPLTLSINFARVPYWRYHQTGTSRMPARPVIDLTGANKSKIISSIKQGLIQRLKRI